MKMQANALCRGDSRPNSHVIPSKGIINTHSNINYNSKDNSDDDNIYNNNNNNNKKKKKKKKKQIRSNQNKR